MQVTVFGPNLRDQSKGSNHVHAAGCGDCKHYGRSGKFGGEDNGWTIEVGSQMDVVTEIYCDILSDYGLEPGTPEGDEMLADWLCEIWFAPCIKSLPINAEKVEA